MTTLYHPGDFQQVRADEVREGDLIACASEADDDDTYYACLVRDAGRAATLGGGWRIVLVVEVIPGYDIQSHEKRTVWVSWKGDTPDITFRTVYDPSTLLYIIKKGQHTMSEEEKQTASLTEIRQALIGLTNVRRAGVDDGLIAGLRALAPPSGSEGKPRPITQTELLAREKALEALLGREWWLVWERVNQSYGLVPAFS